MKNLLKKIETAIWEAGQGQSHTAETITVSSNLFTLPPKRWWHIWHWLSPRPKTFVVDHKAAIALSDEVDAALASLIPKSSLNRWQLEQKLEEKTGSLAKAELFIELCVYLKKLRFIQTRYGGYFLKL